jgi:GT2 family glycosyltransferase
LEKHVVIVSIVIPTHNRSDALAETLLNLAGQKFEGSWEVVVVNNLCTDDTDEVVRRQSFPVPLRLIHEGKPGAAAARNAGIRAAEGRYVILLDNDILVEPDFIRLHHDLLLANPGCWILGQVVNLPEQNSTPFGKFRRDMYGYIPRESAEREAHWLAGTNFSMPRADWERLGGFDEQFSGASVEDYDFAVRAWQIGIKILFQPKIVAIHNDWAGFSIEDYCRRQRLYSQSEPLFWRKYGDRHIRLDLVRQNMPPNLRRDGPMLLAKKLLKNVLASRTWQKILSDVCALLERKWPWPPLLHLVYRLMLAVAIYQGFQEGLRLHQIVAKNSVE